MLRYEDRNSMGNSVESRLPFLDSRLAEWAIAAPVSLKLRDGYGKWILRRVAASRLPREVVEDRAKRGFDVRVEEWMAAGLAADTTSENSTVAVETYTGVTRKDIPQPAARPMIGSSQITRGTLPTSNAMTELLFHG